MLLLNAGQIAQKVRRLAIEIVERNYSEKALILAGVNDNGMAFAELIREAMQSIEANLMEIRVVQVRLDPRNPVATKIAVDLPPEAIEQKVVLLVDDVANTGRTLQYAMLPFLEALPKKIETVVLVDRMHKHFPVSANYVGLTLATTLRQNIEVALRGKKKEEMAVFLR